MLDYLHEVDHMSERVKRLEQAITEAVKLAAPAVREVVKGLQALRGIAQISAVTIAAELGNITRFESARQLMGYSGAVPSEDSSGKRMKRGWITKTGNAHLRRIAVEAAWSYRLRPGVGPALRKRQEGLPEEIKEIAWKAQIRLTNATQDWRRQARTSGRSSPPWDASCWVSSGPSGSRRKRQSGSRWRPEEKQQQKQKQKLSKE